MFSKGDKVVYGSTGVCLVTDMCEKELIRGKKQQYYVLTPVYQQNSVIYAPVEGGKVTMRHIMSTEEANQLIQKIPEISESATPRTIGPEEIKAAFSDRTCQGLVEITAAIYAKRKAARAVNKKLGFIDEKYMHQAEGLLFGELSAALDIPYERVHNYIFEKLGVAEAE